MQKRKIIDERGPRLFAGGRRYLSQVQSSRWFRAIVLLAPRVGEVTGTDRARC